MIHLRDDRRGSRGIGIIKPPPTTSWSLCRAIGGRSNYGDGPECPKVQWKLRWRNSVTDLICTQIRTWVRKAVRRPHALHLTRLSRDCPNGRRVRLDLGFQDWRLLKRQLQDQPKAKVPHATICMQICTSHFFVWKSSYLQLKAQQPQSGHMRLLSESHFEIQAWWNVCSQGNLATVSPEPNGTKHTAQLSSARSSGQGAAERPWTSAVLAAGLATVSSRASNIS